jgi:tetratricopeptide (TPR) repeat protein
MALRGDLLAAELGNLLQLTAGTGRSGTLLVQMRSDPAKRRRLVVKDGTVRSADPAPAPSPAMLAVLGLVGYEDYRLAARRSGGGDPEVVAYLQAKGVLDAEALAIRALESAREYVLEIFLWRDVRFSFDESSTSPADAVGPAFLLDELLLEAARRLDERARFDEALGASPPLLRRRLTTPRDEASAVAKVVFEAVDGVRDPVELSSVCGLPRFHADAACVELLVSGAVETVPDDELPSLGDALAAEKRPLDALRVWRRALRVDRADPGIHRRLANVYEQTGRPAKACAHWRFVAGLSASAGRTREALDLYHLTWRLLPSRFATLETIVGLLSKERGPRTRDDRSALVDAKKLVATLCDLGEDERALKLADALLVVEPTDREALAASARLNARAGRRDAAAAAWLVLADLLAEDGDLRRALDTVRAVAAFDPAGAKLYEVREADLERRLAEARRVRGARRKRRAATFLFALLSLAYAVYAWCGERAVAPIDGAAVDGAAECEEAALRAEGVARRFMFTPAGVRAREKAEAWRRRAASLTEDRAKKDAASAADRALRREESERRLGEARYAIRSGRLDDAVKEFRFAITAAGGRGSADAAVAEGELAEVERYMAEARALLTEADAKEAADPETAFALRARAARDYEAAPDVARLRLTVTVDTTPPGGWLVLDDGAVEGRAPLTAPVRARGALRVEARADGCLPRRLAIPLPPTSSRRLVALERTPSLIVEAGEPLAAAAFASAERAIVAARNGRVFGVDLRSGTTTWRFAPDAVETQRRAPVVSGDVAWCVVESGRGRIFEWATGVLRAETRSTPSLVVRAASGGFLYVDGASVGRRDARGVAVELARLPEGAVGVDVVERGGAIFVAAGPEGLFRVADGAARRVVDGPATAVAFDRDGALFVLKPGFGVARLDPNGAATLVAEEPDVRGLIDVSGTIVLRTGLRGVATLGAEGRLSRVELPSDATDAAPSVDLELGRVGFETAGGWTSVLDVATLDVVAGRGGDHGARPAMRAGRTLDPRATGRLLVLDER